MVFGFPPHVCGRKRHTPRYSGPAKVGRASIPAARSRRQPQGDSRVPLCAARGRCQRAIPRAATHSLRRPFILKNRGWRRLGVYRRPCHPQRRATHLDPEPGGPASGRVGVRASLRRRLGVVGRFVRRRADHLSPPRSKALTPRRSGLGPPNP